MKVMYPLYLLLLLLSSLSFWVYLRLGDVEEKVRNERESLERSLREVRRTAEKLKALEGRVSEEGIRKHGEREALELLLSYLDTLKKGFEMRVVRDLSKEEGLWTVDLSLRLKPTSGKDLSSKVERLLSSKSPVVFLNGIRIDTREGSVELSVSLKQPFLEEKR